MMNETNINLSAQIISRNINALLNYAAKNRKIYNPQILTFLEDLEDANLLSEPTMDRNAKLANLLERNDITEKISETKKSSSSFVNAALNHNLGYQKIMQLLNTDRGDQRFRVSTAYNCGNSLQTDPYINAMIAACVNPQICYNAKDFNTLVYINALKFLNELNYTGKTSDEAEELDNLITDLHAENEEWLNSFNSTITSKCKK